MNNRRNEFELSLLFRKWIGLTLLIIGAALLYATMRTYGIGDITAFTVATTVTVPFIVGIVLFDSRGRTRNRARLPNPSKYRTKTEPLSRFFTRISRYYSWPVIIKLANQPGTSYAVLFMVSIILSIMFAVATFSTNNVPNASMPSDRPSLQLTAIAHVPLVSPPKIETVPSIRILQVTVPVTATQQVVELSDKSILASNIQVQDEEGNLYPVTGLKFDGERSITVDFQVPSPIKGEVTVIVDNQLVGRGVPEQRVVAPIEVLPQTQPMMTPTPSR